MLDRARRELAQYYPTYATFEPLSKDHVSYEHQLRDDLRADELERGMNIVCCAWHQQWRCGSEERCVGGLLVQVALKLGA